MEIELDGPPPSAEWPAGLRAEPVDYEHEAEAFHATLDEAFAEEFGHEPESGIDWRARRERRAFDPTLWSVVKDGDEVAAALLCAERFGSGWIASIGVRKPWRRRGLGFALLLDGFNQLYARGQRRIALGVDARTPPALRVSTSAQACIRCLKQSSTRSRCPCNRGSTPQV